MLAVELRPEERRCPLENRRNAAVWRVTYVVSSVMFWHLADARTGRNRICWSLPVSKVVAEISIPCVVRGVLHSADLQVH